MAQDSTRDTVGSMLELMLRNQVAIMRALYAGPGDMWREVPDQLEVTERFLRDPRQYCLLL